MQAIASTASIEEYADVSDGTPDPDDEDSVKYYKVVVLGKRLSNGSYNCAVAFVNAEVRFKWKFHTWFTPWLTTSAKRDHLKRHARRWLQHRVELKLAMVRMETLSSFA